MSSKAAMRTRPPTGFRVGIVYVVGSALFLAGVFALTQMGYLCSYPLKTAAVSKSFPKPDVRTGHRRRINRSLIWMGNREVDLVLRQLGNVQTYLEWGSGGSTQNFAQFAKKRAVSIEHNSRWCRLVDRRLQAANVTVEMRCVEIKKGRAGWAGGLTEGNYIQFRPYVDEISRLGQRTWDFVLIDGRARVDCAIKALSYISATSKVVLHDSERFSKRWNHMYLPMLEYYDVIESTGGPGRQGVALLMRKRAFQHLEGNHRAVQEILNERYKLSE